LVSASPSRGRAAAAHAGDRARARPRPGGARQPAHRRGLGRDRRRGRPTRLAHRHLGQGRRRPAGHRPCGHRRLGARRPAGPPAWRADRRGGPGAGAAGHVREQLRERLAGSSGGPGGGGCTAPADAGQASASCSSGHALATVSAADTGRPDTVTAPPAPADTLDTAAAVRLAAPGHGRRLRRTARADTPATALRNTAAVRAPACDRVRPACRNQHGCGLR
jgi:hypothetical protein